MAESEMGRQGGLCKFMPLGPEFVAFMGVAPNGMMDKMEKDITKVKGFLEFESRKDMTKTEIADMFSEVAESYDEVHVDLQDKKPYCIAETLAEIVDSEKRKNFSILDVAAGTGRVGEELQKLGFACIDWLDPAEGMRTVASKKNIYRQFFLEFMDGHEIQSIPTGFYDCVTVCAGFNEGLIPCAGISEMIRITKPGGYISFMIADKHFEGVPEYANRLRPLFDKLQNDGTWKRVLQKRYTDFVLYNRGEGSTVHCYQVVK